MDTSNGRSMVWKRIKFHTGEIEATIPASLSGIFSYNRDMFLGALSWEFEHGNGMRFLVWDGHALDENGQFSKKFGDWPNLDEPGEFSVKMAKSFEDMAKIIGTHWDFDNLFTVSVDRDKVAVINGGPFDVDHPYNSVLIGHFDERSFRHKDEIWREVIVDFLHNIDSLLVVAEDDPLQ